MSWIRNPGRITGLIYFSMVLTGPLTLIYIPSKLFVHGNAAATSANIAAHETLFRVGMFVDLIEGLQALALTLVIYLFFRHVDRIKAALVVMFGGVIVAAIYFVNTATYAGALLFARGEDYLSVFTKPQRDAFVMLFVRLHHSLINANEIFWGLWLIPLAILLYKSRSIPRVLEVWLFLNAIPYLVSSFNGLVLPQYESRVWNLLTPLTWGELAVMLWLLIVGTKAASPVIVTPLAAQES